MPETTRKKTYIKLIILTIAVIALDIITKELVKSNMFLGQNIPVWGNFFNLTYVHNYGGAFGIKLGSRYFYIIAAIVATVVMVMWLLQKKHTNIGITGISLMFGGAMGNLWDRVTFGKVIDYLNFGIGDSRWPFFNIADSAITAGIVLLMIDELFFNPDKPKNIPVETCNKNDTTGNNAEPQNS